VKVDQRLITPLPRLATSVGTAIRRSVHRLSNRRSARNRGSALGSSGSSRLEAIRASRRSCLA
jgi:hypothetical protein